MAKRSCNIDGCDVPSYARGMCNKHYRRFMLTGDPLFERYTRQQFCSVEKCEQKCIARGLCHMHYKRWQTNGEPGPADPLRIIGNDEARFWSHVDLDGPEPFPPAVGPCWVWTASCNEDGYGTFYHQGQNVRAHRFSWELHVGPIPDDYEVDHLCRNRPCIRPTHLEAVHGSENARRGTIARAGGVWWQSTTTPLLTSY